MKKTLFSIVVVLVMALLMLPTAQTAQAAGKTCYSNVLLSGNWTDASSWTNCDGGIPGAGDTAIIQTGHHIYPRSGNIVVDTIRVQRGSTLECDPDSGNQLTVTHLILEDSLGSYATAGTASGGTNIAMLTTGVNTNFDACHSATIGSVDNHGGVWLGPNTALTVTGTFTNTGAITTGNNSTLALDGGTIIGSVTVSNLAVTTFGGTLNGNAMVNGNLTLDNDLNVGTNTLTISGTLGTTSGNFDVIGTTRRTIYGLGINRPFAFGSQFTTLQFASLDMSIEATVTLTKSTPSGLTDAVNRTYAINIVPLSGAVDVQLHYRDSEASGIDQSKLQLWRNDGSRWNLQTVDARVTNSGDANYVKKNGVSTFSTWGIAITSPTTVTLSSLNARPSDSTQSYVVVTMGALVILVGGVSILRFRRTIRKV